MLFIKISTQKNEVGALKFKKGADMFNNKCKYASRCAAYQDNSYTCTKAFDKLYCGVYRKFLSGAIKTYKQDFDFLECSH
jgi:hypothetical protein